MYETIKTDNESNPPRTITTGSGKAVENLSIFVKNASPQKLWHKNKKHKKHVKHNWWP